MAPPHHVFWAVPWGMCLTGVGIAQNKYLGGAVQKRFGAAPALLEWFAHVKSVDQVIPNCIIVLFPSNSSLTV